MKRWISGLIFLLAASTSCLSAGIRAPAVAGTWYPSDPAQLRGRVEELLNAAGPKARLSSHQLPLALVVPHAGWTFSGPTAAAGFACLKGRTWKRVVLIGPSHQARFEGIALSCYDSYQTPLGLLPVDRAAVHALERNSLFRYQPGTEDREHCLESQLPFLQVLFPKCSILPLLAGYVPPERRGEAAHALAKLLDRDTLLVVSSDFTHFGPAYGFTPFRKEVPQNLRKWAEKAGNALASLDDATFREHLARTGDTICGAIPLEIAVLALKDLALKEKVKGEVVDYTCSGQVLGDWTNAVSYVSILFVDPPEESSGALSAQEKKTLLLLARRSLDSLLAGKPRPVPGTGDLPLTPRLRTARGAFVTLTERGELRGCIGYVLPTVPLYQAVMDMAGNAATRDPRFSPVTASELSRIRVEISALSTLSPCSDVRKIVVGKHGLLLRFRGNSGLLLPQVPLEFGWNREQFLEALCQKAGVPPGSWREKDCEIQWFTAEVFHE